MSCRDEASTDPHVWRDCDASVSVCLACGVTSGPSTPGSAQNVSDRRTGAVSELTRQRDEARAFLLAHAARHSTVHAEVGRAYEALGGRYAEIRAAADSTSIHPTIPTSTEATS